MPPSGTVFLYRKEESLSWAASCVQILLLPPWHWACRGFKTTLILPDPKEGVGGWLGSGGEGGLRSQMPGSLLASHWSQAALGCLSLWFYVWKRGLFPRAEVSVWQTLINTSQRE